MSFSWDLPPSPPVKQIKDYMIERSSTHIPSTFRTEQMDPPVQPRNNYLEFLGQEKNVLNTAFFSPANIEYIQNALRFHVFDTTEKVIDYQSEQELVLVMRGIYFTEGKLQTNLNKNKKEIARLDTLVIQYTLPVIVRGIHQFETFRENINTSIKVNDLPQSTTVQNSLAYQ